ncbi:hypothetical protein MMC22_011008 [Lobaria immixta]|nr:hypothetical protein [Lobaria immixta]
MSATEATDVPIGNFNEATDVSTTKLNDKPDENAREIEKRRKETERKAAKRKRDANKSLELQAPIVCEPTKYSFYDAPANTVGHSIIKYLSNLQQNDAVARPTNWASVLLDSSIRKKYHVSLSNRKSDKEPIQQHVWHQLNPNHYSIASTIAEFQNQLDSGLYLPVLIPPSSELGLTISSQSTWSGESLEALLDEILQDKSAPIEVQDHSIPTLHHFTMARTSEVVRSRFELNSKDRGCPWNCLEIDDCLSGFKRPKSLEHGANLYKWQLTDPNAFGHYRSTFTPITGAKTVVQWLLISEENSGSTAHVDVGFAT